MIVAYVRVSTEEQAKSGLGLEDQMGKIHEAVAKLGAALRAVVVDDGNTAGVDVAEREKLIEAIGLLQKGDTLLVVKRDRLSRGDPVAMAMIERMVAKRRATILSLAGEGTERSTAGARFERRIHDAVAELELGQISERTSAALQAKRRRGEVAGRVPYGWRAELSPDVGQTKRGRPGRKLVRDEKEQLAITRMRDLRARGLSLRAVAEKLGEEGLTARDGRAWHHDSVRRVLGETKGRGPGVVYGSEHDTRTNGERGGSTCGS